MKNQKTTFIRSTKVSLKFSNKEKLKIVKEVHKEYSKVVNQFIQILWFSSDLDKIQSFLPKEITSQVDSWLSARMLQSAGKQEIGRASCRERV